MKKLSIKDIVDFRGKSDRSKRSFVLGMKQDKEKLKIDGGGDYWISSISSISNSYKSNSLEPIIDKQEKLKEKLKETDYERTKTMYVRNIAILDSYKNFDLRKWRPSKKMEFVKKHKEDSLLTINGFQVQVVPHHVFIIQKNETKEIGAIWFIAKLDGFRKEELGMFADILYRYLNVHFSEKHVLSSKYCIAVDVFNNVDVSYSQLEKGEVSAILNLTLEEIKKLM